MQRQTAIAAILILALLFSVLSGVEALQYDYSQFEGLPYQQPPTVLVMSPFPNGTYNVRDVNLNVTVLLFGFIYPNVARIKWLNYSLDGQTIIPMTLSVPSNKSQLTYLVHGQDMLTGLSDGKHSLTIYGETTIDNLVGTFNETVSFTVDTSPDPITTPSPSPTVPEFSPWIVLPMAMIIAIFAVVFRKKENKTAKDT